MVRTLKLAAALALVVAATARAEDKKPADGPFDDATFVKMAASDGLHEVAANKVALEKAKGAEVKKFAERMIKDHTAANEELKAAAKAAGLAVPEKMTEKHQKHVEMFTNYKGTDFDADFMKHMVTDHTEAVALFTRASKEAKNPQIKEFATKTLPVLREHLEMAQKLSK